MARGASAAAPSGFETFTADALDAYRLYVVEVRHPVEVPGDERAHLVAVAVEARRLRQLRAPDLEQDRPEARRRPAAAGPDRADGVLHVRDRLRRALHALLRPAPSDQETALRYIAGDSNSAYYWVDRNLFYVLSGPAERTISMRSRRPPTTRSTCARDRRAGEFGVRFRLGWSATVACPKREAAR